MKKCLPFVIIISFLVVAYFIISYSKEDTEDKNQALVKQILQPEFIGEKGEEVYLTNRQIKLTAKILNDNLAHYYHVEIPGGKIIYFFVIKDEDGIYRAAANACQVCFDARMGFRQQGNFMVCNTCSNKYPLGKIATEKGGCNPSPINPNLEVKDGKIIIKQSDLEQVAEFF